MGPARALQGMPQRGSPRRDVITLCGMQLPSQAPIFHYLSHLLARPAWEQKARDDFMGTLFADLARSQYLPMNAFERLQILNTILIALGGMRDGLTANVLGP